jgi:hypothetical protein
MSSSRWCWKPTTVVPRPSGERLRAEFGTDMNTNEVLETPFLLIGTIEEMAEQVVRVANASALHISLFTTRTWRPSRRSSNASDPEAILMAT